MQVKGGKRVAEFRKIRSPIVAVRKGPVAGQAAPAANGHVPDTLHVLFCSPRTAYQDVVFSVHPKGSVLDQEEEGDVGLVLYLFFKERDAIPTDGRQCANGRDVRSSIVRDADDGCRSAGRVMF